MGVHIAVTVDLQRAHEADVQAAVVIEVELVGHVIDRGRADHGAEHRARGRKAAHAAALHGEGDVVQHAVLPGVVGDRLRDADAHVDDVFLPQLLRGAPPDDAGGGGILPPGGGQGLDAVRPSGPLGVGDLKAAGEGRVGLVPPAGLHHHDGVHQAAGDDGVAGAGGGVHQAVHLHDHLAAVGLAGLADGQGVAGHVHVVKGDVPPRVRRRALDQGRGDLRELIVEELLPVHLHQLHQGRVLRKPVDARAFPPGIDEDVQAHLGQRAGQAARLGADGVGDAAEGQVVGLEAVLQDDLLGGGHGAEMTADQLVHGAVADVALGGAVFVPHAEARAGDHRQVPRRPGLGEPPPDGLVEFHGVLDAHKGVHADAGPVRDHPDGLVGGHDLVHGTPPLRKTQANRLSAAS